ncbi:hypothetical protein, partial [Mangrovicoccus sp. HB161399]|uniref:hypothetical protein n=1 Tax=Mangrovicoccus sp. HB161399 TaxID=2720392 RepID=UPI00155804B4
MIFDTDIAAPTLQSLTIPTNLPAATSGQVSFSISARARDDYSGIGSVSLSFGGIVSGAVSSSSRSSSSSSGGWTYGEVTTNYGVGLSSRTGILTIRSATVEDLAGNSRTYAASELQSLGVNTEIQIGSVVSEEEQSAADTTPPTLLTLNIPSTIDLGDGEAVLEISATAVDD